MGGIVFNFILLAVFSAFLKMSFDIEDLREVDPLGAAGFPKFILVLLVILLLISLINTIREYVKNGEGNTGGTSNPINIYGCEFSNLNCIIYTSPG
ncbi:hypothetical protein ABRT01_12350 [Lentibacillus sp. L22]|uniref:hypothetical protein n=1 Tax=Lentibacillus sp. L22 TaxID=3163028 RepID=UPI003467886F